MPMNPRDYPKDWKAISHRIRFERAGGKCEQCGAPHGEIIARSADPPDGPGLYMLDDGRTFRADTGEYVGLSRGSEFPDERHTLICLTTAHVDHDLSHNDDDNLRALCQKCHLRHDAQDNARRRKYGRVFIARSEQIQFTHQTP